MAAKPLQEGRKVSITADEAANLLKNADLKLCIKEPPACPLDGQIFIFKPSNPRFPDGWKDDGFLWRIISSSQQPRRNPQVLKRVYALQLPDNTVCRELRKEVYCSRNSDDEKKLTLLHYLGKFEYAESIEEAHQSATIGTQEEMEPGNNNAVYVVQEDSMPEFAETVFQGAITQPSSVENAESNVSAGGTIPNPEQSSDTGVSSDSNLANCSQEDDEAGITSSSEPSASPQEKPVERKAQVSSSSTKQAADSSTGSEDIEMALKTLQSALQKKLGSKPVMDMVSKLVESVTSTEENADIDYCLVVSDKKSGKRSVIGTPEIASRVKRRMPGGGHEGNQDADRIQSKTGVKTNGKAKAPVVVKKEKMPNQPAKQIPSVTELEENDILTASGDIIHFPEPTSEMFFNFKIVSEEEKRINSDFFEDSRRRSKNVEKYLKIRNHIIQTWQKQKPTYLTKSKARKGLKDCGDVTPISRIHTYLECKGVINFNAVRDTSRPWLRKGRSEPDQTNSPESKRRKITSLGGQDSEEQADSDLDADIDEKITKEKVDEKSSRKRARAESSQQSEVTETPAKRIAAGRKRPIDSKNKNQTQENITVTKTPPSSPFKTPSTKGLSEDVVSVRTSSRRTRNVATPNWADIMSGKKSFKKDGAVMVHVKSEPVSDEEEAMNDEKSPSKKPEVSHKKSPLKKGKAKSLNKELNAYEDTMDVDNSETNEVQEVTKEIVSDVVEESKKPVKENTRGQDVKEEKKSIELEKTRKKPVKNDTGDVKEEKKSLELKKTSGDEEISSPENTIIPESSPHIAYKYACSECDKKFNISQQLEDHMKKVHSKAVDGVDTEDEAAVEDMEGDEDDDYADELDIIGYDDEYEDPDFNASGSDEDVDNGDNDSNYMPEANQKKRSTEERTTFSDDELEDKVMGTLTPGQKPTCKICGLVFLSKANLKKHTLLHTNKMYECPFCAKLMKRKDYVKHHIRKVHKEHDIEKNPIDFDKYTHIVEPEVNVKEDENDNGNDGKEATKRRKPSKMKVIAGIGKKVCPECNKLFDIQEELEAHMVETHNKELKDAAYTCQACKKQFKTLVSFQVHKLSHRKKDHVCSHCGQKFSNNSQLQVHRRNDHQIQYGTLMYFGYLINDGKLACEICTTDFENVDEFHKHRPTHIIYENLCTKCGNGFESSEELENHIKSDCSEVNLHLKCGVCDQKFSMYDSRRKHVLTNHPKTTDFFCHHCGICFEDMAALTDHFPIHKEEKIFICEYCGKRFFEKRNLVDHRELHRSSKNWQCHICDKYYISSKSLQRHIKLHLRNKFKACKYCPSKFGTAEELDEHTLKEHLDEESGNTCRVCEKSFLDKDRLVKHMQIHADNMYTCEICGGTFDSVQEPVWKHMKKTHPLEASSKSKRTFQCDLCDFTAPFKNRLERHMETHNAGKEFECRYCGKMYKTTSSLFTHMIIHRGKVKKGAKPQPICTWTRCNKQYTKHSLYKRHLISHIFRVKVGKDLCECGQCVYSTPQLGQTFFVHENTEYSAVGYVDDDGNPLVATRLLNMDNQRTVDQATDKSEPQEKGYGSMNVLQEAIARIEDIESKDSIAVKNNTVKTEKGTQAEESQDQQMEGNLKEDANNAGGLRKAAAVQVSARQAVNSETDQVESDRSENMVVEIINTTAEDFGNVDLQTMGYNYECGVCELIFRHKCQVVMHMEEDHPEHKFPQCPTCNKIIIDEKNLREHVTIHEDSKDFKCHICNKAFRTKQILRQHSHIHSTEKPFTCNFCGHGFTQKGFYLEHIRRHTGVKPFKCSVCSKAFVSKNLLRIHMYSHANTRPFQCELCPKSFSENYQLNCHMRTHNEDRPFECTECDKAFFVRSKLIRHMNTVHGIDKEELSNYVATRIGDGIGYRDKTKVINQDSKQALGVQEDFTRVVYVDVHGNMVSQKIPVSAANKDDSQPSINPKPNTSFISISGEELSKSGGKFLQIANTFVNLETGLSTKRVGENMPPYEVVTRQDKMGNIKISDVRQVLPNSRAHEEIALSDSNSVELNGQSYTFVTQGEGEGQIALITETLNDAEAAGDSDGQGQIQMITANDGMLADANQETMEVVSEAMMTHQVEGAPNLSINIGEDGTLDPADFEKIEALQSMYGDQQIVIVLESKPQ